MEHKGSLLAKETIVHSTILLPMNDVTSGSHIMIPEKQHYYRLEKNYPLKALKEYRTPLMQPVRLHRTQITFDISLRNIGGACL